MVVDPHLPALRVREPLVQPEQMDRALLANHIRELPGLGHLERSLERRTKLGVEHVGAVAASLRGAGFGIGARVSREGVRLGHDLLANSHHPLPRDGEVRLLGPALDHGDLQRHLGRSREFLGVGPVVRLDVGPADLGRVDREAVRGEGDVADLHLVVDQLEPLANVRLRHLGRGDDLLLELLLRERLGHVVLDLRPGHLRVGVVQLRQVFPVVELAVRLESGGLHHELGGRGTDHGLDLIRRDRDAAAADFLLHELARDHVAPGLLADVAVLPLLDLPALPDTVEDVLVHPVEFFVPDRLAIDPGDHAGGTAAAAGGIQHASELEHSESDEEDDRGGPDDHLHVVAHRLHHDVQTSIESVRNRSGAPAGAARNVESASRISRRRPFRKAGSRGMLYPAQGPRFGLTP